MRTLNTIQMTREEDLQILKLKKALKLPSKKSVVLKAIRALQDSLLQEERVWRLKQASLKIRKTSRKANKEWAALSTALKDS